MDPSGSQASPARDPRKGRFYLLRVDDFDDRFELPGTNVVVGRDADCQLRLDDTKVSGRHCTLMWHNDTFRIVDLDSRNGVRVNGRKVSAGKLASGDMLQIGPRRFFYWRDGEPLPTFDPDVDSEAVDLVDEAGMDSDASDRKVAVPVPTAVTASETESATMAPATPAVTAAAAAAVAEVAAPAASAPATPAPATPATPAPVAAATVAEVEVAAAVDTSPAPSTGLQFADDTDELRIQTRPQGADTTPEALAALLHRGAAPVAPVAAVPGTAAALMPPPSPASPAGDVRTSGRQRKANTAGMLARTLPPVALAAGLLFFAIGLVAWVVGSATAARAEASINGKADDANEDLELLRIQLGAVRTELGRLVERREALEQGLSDASRDQLIGEIAALSQRIGVLVGRLGEIESRMSAVLDRVDQIESAVRRYEAGETPKPRDNSGK
ncbi:MAG: FHA domain-containing protein [Planctomycetota bacterium]